ncbi:MAG: chalcone isomerase family protein [Rhodovibrionaceae bacterium]|nr:chalcone isomerase family protein [Rhodovibrionaceae bacterium]
MTVALCGSAPLANAGVPGRITVAGEEFHLKGQGSRSRLTVDLYHCALYVAEPSTPLDVQEMLESGVAIRVTVTYEDMPHEMPDAWSETLEDEVSRKILTRLEDAFYELATGDVILVTYRRDEGTVIYVNRDELLVRRDSGIAKALLQQWLGPEPVSHSLKQALLGN